VLPSGALTVALLLALVPGWVYLRLRSTANAALPRTGLDELLEVVAVGFATTGIAVALWALIPADMSRLADIRSLARDGAAYGTAHPQRIAATGLMVLAVALGLAYVLFKVTQTGELTYVRETVWAGALGWRDGRYAWVGLMLRDGRLVEGQLRTYPVGDEHEHRDIALQRPIRITQPGAASAMSTDLDRLIFNESDIKYITMIFGPDASNPTSGKQALPVTERDDN
jgi:hypothetical protein